MLQSGPEARQESKNELAPQNNNIAYLIVLIGIVAAMHVWKLPPALPTLQRELGFTLVQSGFLLSLVQFGGMTLGLAAGLLAEKIGLRRCMLIGLVLLSGASVGGAIFSSAFALLMFRAVEGVGFLLVVMPAPGLIKRHGEPAYLSRLLGVWATYIPAGSVVVLILGSWVLSLAGWRALWWLLAIMTAIMALLMWRLVPPDNHGQDRPPLQKRWQLTSPTHVSPSSWAIVKVTLSSQNVWLVALTFAFYTCQWVAIISFLPSIYEQAGVSGTNAGLLTAVASGVNVTGGLMAGYLLHRGVLAHVLLWIGFGTMALASVCAFSLDIPATWQFIAVVVFSAVGGLIPGTIFSLAIRLAPSAQTTSTTVGWMQQCSAFGQFVGPPIVAWVVTITGGWQATWTVTVTCAVLGMVLAARIGTLASRSR